MAHKKLVLAAALVAVAASATLGGAVFAHGFGHDHTANANTSTTEIETKLTDEQKQKVTERKAEIKQRVETKRAEATAKLADKRLAACEKHQDKVNSIFAKATNRNAMHLAVFQKIEERVKAFYVNKNLSVDGYEAAVTNADEKEAAAVAAIEASSEITFNCTSADATKPGAAIKEAMQARHSALKQYRTAVKDLILIVKKHHGQQQNTSTDQVDSTNDGSSSTGTGTREVDTATEGVQ